MELENVNNHKCKSFNFSQVSNKRPWAEYGSPPSKYSLSGIFNQNPLSLIS